MNFALTDEQVMIRDAAQTFLAERSTSEAVRAAMQQPHGFDPAVWASLATELGWCALPVSEELGGMGMGPVELMLVQEQAGYRLLCAPFFSTVCLATTLLNECADAETQAQLLPALAAGELLMSAPLPSASLAWNATTLRAEQLDGAWQLSGNVAQVPDGQVAQQLLVPALCGNAIGLFLVAMDAQGLTRVSRGGWDESRRFTDVQLASVSAQRCDAANLVSNLQRTAALLQIYIAAEQLGCAQRCLDLTVAYTLERKQFGRAVGSFQAVKHRCAQMMIHCESVRSVVYGAAASAAGQIELAVLQAEAATAASLATEALQYCSGEAIQLYGGVGFTWEYDPQLFFKRGQASAHWLGTSQQQRALVAAQLLD